MKRTIFYSWQSDSPKKWNRNLIEEALERALKSIKRDEAASIDPALDRDTSGISGSPAIADTILRKIAAADVFVADVTIISKAEGGKPSPNPNVLVELGYAIARLGWNRILLVQNDVYGGPEKLPFDLLGHAVIKYSADDTSDRSELRGLLQGRLEYSLRSALSASAATGIHAGPDVPLWWGQWAIPDRYAMHGGYLFIREVGSEGFLFDIEVFNGSHMGRASGFARIVSPDLAYARLSMDDDGKPCELIFRRSLENRSRVIAVEEVNCLSYHGMGVTFDGRYAWKPLWPYDSGNLDELDLQRIYALTGQYFQPLMDRFMQIGAEENRDTFTARILHGGVRGLYTIMEAIIMRGDRGELWVAYLEDEAVRYFTTENEFATKLPNTIEHWRSRFADTRVILDSVVDQIPPQQP